MYEFNARSWHMIKGRGAVAMIDRSENYLHDPVLYYGMTVRIDGTEYYVKGVESFAITRSPDQPYKLDFGLLIERTDV